MCNAYRVHPKPAAADLAATVSAEIRKLPSELVRRTGPGVVVTFGGGLAVASVMRWGFHRPFGSAINNARSDHLDSPVWAEAFRLRRCLVPISCFYEWQHLPGGRKQAFEFRRADGDWMWVAGLFEPSVTHGPCYATITTEPSPLVEPIHDRMLAVLEFDAAMDFLRGGPVPFPPYLGNLTAQPCESPLRRTSASPPNEIQPELF